MPAVKPIPSLLDTCQQVAGDYCLTTLMKNYTPEKCENDLSDDVEQFLLSDAKKYMQGLILSLRNDLVKFVLDQLLHCELLNSFDLISGLHSDTEKSKKLWKHVRNLLIICGGEGIRELDFSYERNIKFSYRLNFIVELPKSVLSQTLFLDKLWAKRLVTLKLPDMWDEEIVEQVAIHCRNLQHLDISLGDDELHYRYPNHSEVSCLGYLYAHRDACGNSENEGSGCPKLRTITLPAWNDVEKVFLHAVEMLKYMPDLHVINNIDTRVLAVKYINAIGQPCCMKFTEFEEWRNKGWTKDYYEGLNWNEFTYFPNVRRYASFCYDEFDDPCNQENILSKLANEFPSLDIIEFNKSNVNFWENIDSVHPVTSVRAFRWVESESISLENIEKFSRIFPNLEKLILCTPYFCSEEEYEVRSSLLFPKLKILELVEAVELDEDFLSVVLQRCPLLKTLQITHIEGCYTMDENESITDDLIQELCKSMGNLESIIITKHEPNTRFTNLTYSSVDSMLSVCPYLKYLGNLSDWNISEAEISQLEDSILQNNWDLEISYG